MYMLFKEHIIFINPTSILSSIIFHPEKIYLLRICCIDPASNSVKEGLFSSKQDTLRKNSLHPSQGFIPLPSALYRNGRGPKVTYPFSLSLFSLVPSSSSTLILSQIKKLRRHFKMKNN